MQRGLMQRAPWSLALVQAAPTPGDAAANLAVLERSLAEIVLRPAGDAPARLALFPELFLGGYDLARVAATALPADHPVLTGVARAARASGIAVIVGFAERTPDGRLMNSAAIIDGHGERRGLHRKVHLFDRERDVFTAGTEATVVEIGDLRFGVGICFDLEFPEYVRMLALKGADVLCFPTANMLPWARWQETYASARAMENQCFVAVANRTGVEAGLTFFGESGVFGPDGRRLVVSPGRGAWCGTVRIDPALSEEVAAYPFRYLDERRPGLYRILAAAEALPREPPDAISRESSSMSGQEHYRPRFTEIATFMRLPAIRDPAEADIVLAGIPFDLGVTNRPGPRHGPRQVRDYSSFMRATHHVSHITPTKLCRIGDLGDAPIDLFSIERSVDGIARFYHAIHDAGATPLSVGGDHLTTLPVLRGIAHDRPVGLVHFDSHCDTGGPYMGTALHHGATFKLAVEEGLLDPKRTIQIGIRGSLNDEHQWQFSYESGMRVVGIEEFFEKGVDTVIAEARRVAGDGPTYISFDVDGLDPAHAPGTGTPEAGGFSMFQAQRMVRGLSGLNLIGADVVEVSPPFDPSGNTALNAATIMFEILCILSEAVARRRPAKG